MLYCGEFSAASLLFQLEMATRFFKQSYHLEVSVCIGTDTDGNIELGGQVEEIGPWALEEKHG